MPTTGSNIPPELFERILDTFSPPDDDYMPVSNYVRAEKHELASCSFVCRFWAFICQSKIFRTIALRSREDVYQLSKFTESPVSRVAQYIYFLDIPPQVYPFAPAPWIHLLSLLDRNRLVHLGTISIDLAGPVPGPHHIRSIHAALPKCPPTFSSFIMNLDLRDVHFRSFSHLVHLVSELHSLSDLRCDAVTWSGETLVTRLPSKKHRLRSFRSVEMSGCTLDWSAIWIVLAFQPLEKRAITEDDWTNVSASAHSIEASINEKCTRRTVFATWYNITKGRDHPHLSVLYRGISGANIYLSPEISYAFNNKTHSTKHGRTTTYIDRVALDLSNKLTILEHALKCDWKTFDAHVSRLHSAGLDTVFLGMKTKEEMTVFAEMAVDPSMKHLSEGGNLKYMVKEGGYEWLFASPGSNVTSKSGVYLFFDFLVA